MIELEDIDGKGLPIVNKARNCNLTTRIIKSRICWYDEPLIIIPNVISRHQGTILIGHEVKDKMDLNLSSPIQYGFIDDWDGFKAIIMRIFSKLIQHKTEFAVLISECVGFTKESREKLTKFMFEQVGVIGFFCYSRATLSLYSSGRTTGIVILSDYHCTEIVPIYEGYPLDNVAMKINIGRRDVLRYIDANNLENKNDAFDIMYNPKLSDNDEFKEYNGIHKCIYDCIKKCDVDIRRDMYSNILLSGINTIDFEDNAKAWSIRLEHELHKDTEVPEGYKLRTICPPERNESVWNGGSILCSLSTFTPYWMTKSDYDSHGPSYIHAKVLF